MKHWKSVAIGSGLLVVFISGCSTPSNQHVYAGAAEPPGQVISSGSYASPNTPTQPPPRYSTSPPVFNANANSTALSPDAMLTDRVNQALRSSSLGIAPNNVSVSAQNGVVTLNGTVPNQQQRQMIYDLVRNTSGVGSVNDQLQLSGAPSPVYPQPNTTYTPPPPAQYPATSSAQTLAPNTASTGDVFNLHVQGLNEADRMLAQRILQGLRTDSRLGSLLPTVDINVAQGRVILQGVVQNEQQRAAIESVVRQATGGSNVEDQLQVQGGAAPVTQ